MPIKPSSLGLEVTRICAAVLTLSGIAVVLRVYTRFGLIKHPGVDDYSIILAFLFSATFVGLVCEQARFGLGRHQDTIPPEDAVKALKPFFYSIAFYNLSLTCTKASILTQYLRLVIEKRMRMVCYGMLVLITVYGGWLFFSSIFACTPVSKFWAPDTPGSCLNERIVWFTNAGLNIATDFIIFVLPMPVIRKLNIPRRQKILLVVIFMIGLFTCITSIIRLGALSLVANSNDKTYSNAMAASWSAIEINTAIFCSCVSTLKPLVSRLAPRALYSNAPESSKGPTYPRPSQSQHIVYPNMYPTNSNTNSNAESGKPLCQPPPYRQDPYALDEGIV